MITPITSLSLFLWNTPKAQTWFGSPTSVAQVHITDAFSGAGTATLRRYRLLSTVDVLIDWFRRDLPAFWFLTSGLHCGFSGI